MIPPRSAGTNSGRSNIIRRMKLGIRLVAGAALGRPVPAAAYLYPTFRCNLSCEYCNYPRIETTELETRDWFRIIDELSALGCRWVNILGGEPLLRDDLAEIVGRVRARGMSCLVTSNGLLVERRIESLRGIRLLVLSLDAPGPANDAVRGPGVFRAVERAVPAARSAGVPVKINATLSAVTLPDLDALIDYVNRSDIGLSVNVMRSGSRKLWHRAERIRPHDASCRAALLRLARLARSNRRIHYAGASYRFAASWPDFARDRYEENELPADSPLLRRSPRCRAGKNFLAIGPDGTTYPCIKTVGVVPGGNAAREGVDSAWRKLHGHRCKTCHSTCMIEMNSLFAFKPAVLFNALTRQAVRLP